MTATVHVSAAVVVDDAGRALVVRKHGATVFQQPGGKPDPGETALDAVEPLGRFTDAAANEPGHLVVADAYVLRVAAGSGTAIAAAEIAELRWIGEHEVEATPLAPLSRNQLIRYAWR